MTHLFVLVCDLFLPRFRSLLPECTTCLPVLLWMSLSFLFVCFYKVCCFGAIIRVFCCRARGFSIYTPGGKITGPSLRRSSGGADSTQWFSNEVVLVSSLSRLLPPPPPTSPHPAVGWCWRACTPAGFYSSQACMHQSAVPQGVALASTTCLAPQGVTTVPLCVCSGICFAC